MLTAAAMMGCGSNETLLATVGESRLQIVPFQEHIARVTGETWQAVSGVVSSRLLDQYLDRQVVLESARRADVHLSEGSESLGPTEVRWLLDELCGLAPDPAPAAIEAKVAERMAVVRPAQVHARQVLVDSEDEALAARKRLLEGEDFLLISREMSRAHNAADGGELGFFDQGALTPEIDEVLFALAPGEYSQPVQGPSGFHVFQVLEVIPEGPPERAEVEPAIVTELMQHGAREHTRDCIDRLASEVGVAVHTTNLWFKYEGKYAEGNEDG
jgi:parvulin-like peptidyl-prolyl isomerase